MRGSRDTHQTPIAHTHHEFTKAGTSIGGVGSLHRNNRTVMGVARYIRHPTEPSIPWILSVPPGRESSRTPQQTRKRKQRQITPRKIDRTHIRKTALLKTERKNVRRHAQHAK